MQVGIWVFGKPFAGWIELQADLAGCHLTPAQSNTIGLLSHKDDHRSYYFGGATMKKRIAIMTICLLCMVGAAVLTSDAATTFGASTILGVDQAQRTITFQTRDGQTWTLPVADPNLLKKELVAKGDQVSIEIDLSERITKITKLSEQPRPAPTQSLDDDLRP